MPRKHYELQDVFQQLGLDHSEAAIEHFIAEHRSLIGDYSLEEAPFWTPNQADFLKSGLLEDSEWCLAIDELNLRLHGH